MDALNAQPPTRQFTLFLCGDVMTGRGIDQVLPFHSEPQLYEPHVRNALEYVKLAERAHGAIPRPVDFSYVWGCALEVLDVMRPVARIINLETSVTTSEQAEPKGINYRMHPGNVPVLTRAGVDCCTLANNHVLDWGENGLQETLDTLASAQIAVAGAARDLDSARAPASLPLVDDYSLAVFACASGDSGVPPNWAATPRQPGVWRLPDFSDRTVDSIAQVVGAHRPPRSLTVLSIHWGTNWGYDIPAEHRRFAHALIERAGIDLIFGHSSHQPRAIERYRSKLILYGCGDFLNDYEGIAGKEQFRSDLVLMYFPMLDARTGELNRLELLPLHIRNFRLTRPAQPDRMWLARLLDRECRVFGGHVTLFDDVLVYE